MKLLYCRKCGEIFNLKKTPRACTCGECGGQYLPDGLNAEYYGPAVIFGIDNNSFARAVAMQAAWDREPDPGRVLGAPFAAFMIPAAAPTVKKSSRIPARSGEKV